MTLIKQRFAGLLDRLQPSETAVMLATAVTVGAGTGLGAILFIELIAFVQSLFFESSASLLGFLGRGLFILAPFAGGLLAGPIIYYFAREAKGHGA
jgi:CIC family chloride channel protein